MDFSEVLEALGDLSALPHFSIVVYLGVVFLYVVMVVLVMCRKLCCPPEIRPKTGGKAPGEQSSLYMVQNPALAGQKLGPQFTVPALAFSPTAEQTAALNNIKVQRTSFAVGQVVAKQGKFEIRKGVIKIMKQDSEPIKKIVACKLVGVGGRPKDKMALYHEMHLLAGMRRNRHVVNMVGVSTADSASPTIVLMDYASIGNLGDLLRAGRVESEKRRNADELLALLMQVANGMEFIGGERVVHRNLTLTSVSIGNPLIAKVGNFATARHLDSLGAYRKLDGADTINFKWAAPEILVDTVFSVASDVWSYGICLWELATQGGSPYPGCTPEETVKRVSGGFVMPKSQALAHTSDEYYCLMEQCWSSNRADRPSFQQISTAVVKLMQQSGKSLGVNTGRLAGANDPVDHMKLAAVLNYIQAGKHGANRAKSNPDQPPTAAQQVPESSQTAESTRKEREEKDKLAKELADLKQAARAATEREREAKERLETELANLKRQAKMNSEVERIAHEQRERELTAEKDRLEKTLEMERGQLYDEIERIRASAGSVYVTGGGDADAGTDSSPKSVRWSAALEETKFYVKGSSIRGKGGKAVIKGTASAGAPPPVPAPRSTVSLPQPDVEPPTQKQQKQKRWFGFGRSSRSVDVEAGEADDTARQLPAVPVAESRAALLNMWQDEGNDDDEGMYAEVGPALDDDFEGLYETLDDAGDYEDVDDVEAPEEDTGENDYEVPVVLQLDNTTGESSADGDTSNYALPTPLPSPIPASAIALPGLAAALPGLDGPLLSPVPPPRKIYSLDEGDGGGGEDDQDTEA